MTTKKKKAFLTVYNLDVKRLFERFGFEVIYGSDGNREFPDVIVLPGGSDISSSLYYETPDKLHSRYSEVERDYREMCAITAARLQGIPKIGICRGLQLLHVANGGSLIQHVDGHSNVAHKVFDVAGGEVDGWPALTVNSTHHQAIPEAEASIYSDYLVSRTKDNQKIIEAIMDEDTLTFGVQWHPEKVNAPEDCVAYFDEMIKHKVGALL